MEFSLLLADVFQWKIFIIGILNHKRGMPVGKSSAFRILTTQAHRISIFKQSSIGQQLGHRPIHAVIEHHHATVFHNAGDLFEEFFIGR